MAGVGTVSEDKIEELAWRLPFINASDVTGILPDMPFAPHFDAEYISVLKQGGVTALHASLVTWFFDTFPMSVRRIGALYRLLDQFSDDLLLVQTAEDIVRAQETQKLGIILHLHNVGAIEEDLNLLSVYHRLGVRVMQLTYQGRSLVGDGCGEANPGGLSSFGIRAIAEMNRLGILVDLAHAGPRTFMEALEVSKVPVINSHGTVRALCDNPRNLADEQIRALAGKGGVFGIMAISDCVTPHGATEGATFDDYLRHIEYVAELVGVDHVGIGLENGNGFDDNDMRALRAEFVARMPNPHAQGRVPQRYIFEKIHTPKEVHDIPGTKRNLIRELLKRGFSESEVTKILGSNFLRVYRETWNV